MTRANLTTFILLVSLVLSVTRSVYSRLTFDPDEICSLIPDGTRIKDPRGCNQWIQCDSGAPISGTCPGDQFYDRTTEKCVPYQSIKCISTNPCASTSGADGFVADPYSCNGYYYCSNGSSAHGACSEGLNFNPGTKDCIRNFPCVLQMDPNSYCNIVPDNVFIKNSSNCNGWEVCWEANVVSGLCPGSFYFNPINGKCDYPEKVACTPPTTEPPQLPSTDTCTRTGDFISDLRSCNGYYYCYKSLDSDSYTLIYGHCPNGRFFASTNGGECLPRTLVACSYNRCVNMGQHAIQLANLYDDNCVGYSICQDGEQIGTGVCPSGEYFDEVTQRCTNQTVSYAACALSAAATTTPISSEPAETTTTTTS